MAVGIVGRDDVPVAARIGMRPVTSAEAGGRVAGAGHAGKGGRCE